MWRCPGALVVWPYHLTWYYPGVPRAWLWPLIWRRPDILRPWMYSLTWRRSRALRGLADPEWRRCLWHLRWRDMWSPQVHPLNNLASTHSTPAPTPTPYSGFHICKNEALMPLELLNHSGLLPRKARLRNRPWAWASTTALTRLKTCRLNLHKYNLTFTVKQLFSFHPF